MSDQQALDLAFMRMALEQARQAEKNMEVPVGAVLVRGVEVLSVAFNQPIAVSDPSAHAEILAIRAAAQKIGNYRLPETTLYVTLEPCIMCMGAILHARVRRLVFGALEPRTGAAQSCYTIGTDDLLNHRLEINGGVLEAECSQIIKDFFRKRRAERGEGTGC
jgi:tRNA(adenine34) deaminase